MLKAYDYAEMKRNNQGIQDEKLFNREKGHALKFVLEHRNNFQRADCPICGSSHTRFIFSRWDIEYALCDDCCSIYIPVEEDIIKKYLELKDMKELRISEEYQSQAEIRRADIWNEFIMWVQYRLYRYIGRNTNLAVIDYGNRYMGLVDRFRNSNICEKYDLRDSILDIESDHVDKADAILYMNQLQHEVNPVKTLSELREHLHDDGVLILNTRLGSGFDILTLKGEMDRIFPYEHIMLPSRKGLELILEKAGYELMEITTPGSRDMEAVLKNKEKIEGGNFFVRYLLKTADKSTLADFQQFLQKSGLSSFAQVVARVKRNTEEPFAQTGQE